MTEEQALLLLLFLLTAALLVAATLVAGGTVVLATASGRLPRPSDREPSVVEPTPSVPMATAVPTRPPTATASPTETTSPTATTSPTPTRSPGATLPAQTTRASIPTATPQPSATPGIVVTAPATATRRATAAPSPSPTVRPTVSPAPADRTPPLTEAFTEPEPNERGWHRTDVSVYLSAEDTPEGSGVRDISYSAVGAQPVAARTVRATNAEIRVTAEGQTTVTYAARDWAGNSAPPGSITVRIDKSPPRPPEYSLVARLVRLSAAERDATVYYRYVPVGLRPPSSASLDDWRRYEAPFRESSECMNLYAFVEDAAGNRSEVREVAACLE
ncbi:MAG: hypothetical protein U0821_11035 [Chloroflexota bacterium]